MMSTPCTADDLCECQWDAWEIMPARFAAGAVGMTKVTQQLPTLILLIFYSLSVFIIIQHNSNYLHSSLAEAPTFL